MPRTKKNAAPAAEAAVVETVKTVEAEAPAADKKEAENKPAAKKTAGRKPAAEKKTAGRKPAVKKQTEEKKPAAKRTAEKKAAEENIFIQQNGSEVNAADLIAKSKADAGVKNAEKVDVYVRPEINMVYYVIDGKIFGSFELC